MIKKISVRNFKCFEDFSLPLKRVNLLSGIKGMGKSTVIQSLLLLRQSARDGEMKGLRLNDEYVRLGSGSDILYEKAETEEIELGYEDDFGAFSWKFGYVSDSDILPLIEKRESVQELEICRNNFVYLSAFRIEPQELYRIRNEEEINNREFGNNGEYALQYLNMHGDDTVTNKYVITDQASDDSLNSQVRGWMDRISPGVSPRITVNMSQRNSEIRYEYIEGREKTGSYKSMNVGFGITYVLPLIIALVSAKEGDIILVENPEAHIHPAGQSMLGELIARAGAGGAQLIVETHSDHILNGLRLAVKGKIIPREQTTLSFFYKDPKDGYRHKCLHPTILPDGRLDSWPKGFFDEWENALYELI